MSGIKLQGDKREEEIVELKTEFDPDIRRVNHEERAINTRRVYRKDLINTLNYINFKDGHIQLHFTHTRYHNQISISARPQPCQDDVLDCRWLDSVPVKNKLASYKFDKFIIANGHKLITVEAAVRRIDDDGITMELPELGVETAPRRWTRHICEGIRVGLIQNGVVFEGRLHNLSAEFFSVEIDAIPPQTFLWVNPDNKVYMVLKSEKQYLYSGECRIIRQGAGHKTRIFVLEPVVHQMRRFRPKHFRSTRQKFSPTPNVIFRHPLTGSMINLEIENLSGSGLLVEEEYDHAVLLAGMLIPELYIEFALDFRIRCRGQVVYRNKIKDKSGTEMGVKCGIAILDSDVKDHIRLSGLLHQVSNKHLYVNNKVDMDSLFRFFFETGFVYPKKYSSIHGNKGKFKEVYEKLYIHNPEIARHFIFQEKGNIYGHMSMLRFYEETWLIQHHAANKMANNRAGISVLEQIGQYINDSHSIYSVHMNYVVCYFRPDNKFPNRIFGGATRFINNPNDSSLDLFAYFHFSNSYHKQKELPATWAISRTSDEDIFDLENFYKNVSNGLMLDALDLKPGTTAMKTIGDEYKRLGFKRERHLFSLKRNDELKAIYMLNISDMGLNMSDLTSSINIFVLDSHELTRDIFYSALAELSQFYADEEIPVLCYPIKYVQNQLIKYEKEYNLWVLNMQTSTDKYFEYFEYLRNPTRKIVDFNVTSIISKMSALSSL